VIKRRGGKRGMILILTFIIMITLIAVTSVFLCMTSVQARGSGYAILRAKALWLAEAGLQKALYQLNTDPNYQSNPTPISGSLGDGTYSVTAVKNVSVYAFTSVGTVSSISRKVTYSVALTSSTLVRAIHADGSTLDFQNSTGVVNGNVSCHVQIKNYAGMTINGTITENFPTVRPGLDYAYYQNIATAAGQYVNGTKTFENATYTGVWYVKGKVTIGNNAIINGSVIGEGSIDFAKAVTNVQITADPITNYPALACQQNISTTASGAGGDKIGLQNSAITGLILAGNNISFNWIINSTITGTILAGNNITMSDGTGITINYTDNIFAPMPPGFTYIASGSSAIVSQKDWREVVPAV
jgi:Tfp pilus assembly protein PilX